MKSYDELLTRYEELEDKWADLVSTTIMMSTENLHDEEFDTLQEKITSLRDQMDLIEWFWGGKIRDGKKQV